MTDEAELRELYDLQLSAELKRRLPRALSLSGKTTEASFHGVIGGKNNEYVNAIQGVFLSPQQFIAEWQAGALREAKERDARHGKHGGDSAAHRIVRLLKTPEVRDYIHIFLTRNFYREYNARVRGKPSQSLWQIWFGSNPLDWGLLITPRLGAQPLGWHNDVSEIRRVQFRYWTIGHVLQTGFVARNRNTLHRVANLDALFDLYQNVFIRDTSSVHARALTERYEGFVRSHKSPLDIPFLIPEFRYGGQDFEHKHRLDFTILSVELGTRIGIELSPWSSHGRVRGKKQIAALGGERAVDAERIRQWEAEMSKRNDYYLTFGVTTLTFMDSALSAPDAVFDKLAPHLEPAPQSTLNPLRVTKELEEYGE